VISESLNDTSYSLTGLMSGLTLDWRVTTICDSNYSNYSYSQLTTPCPPPSSISVAGITASSAVVNWTAPSSYYNSPFGYTLQYKLSTTSTWTSTNAVSVSTLTKTLTGLAPGRVYDVRVRLNGYTVNSAYAQTSFSTPCNVVPSGLTYYNVTTGGATVKWNPVAGAVSYNMQYRKTGFPTWMTTTGITTTSVAISGLGAAISYEFQVQMVCASGTTAYSSPVTFTTYCASSGTNNQDWIDYFKFGTMERYSAADAGGYFNAASTYNPLNVTIGTTGIAGIVSAAFSGATNRNEYYAVYIDFNRNGNFTDAGERVVNQTAITNGNNYNFTVNIPATATPGITAIRVVMLRQPTAVAPCLTGNRGETEDYYLNLVTPTAFAGDTEPAYVEVPQVKQVNITASPNPSHGRYNIDMQGDFKAVQYEIVNTNGNIIQRGRVTSSKILLVDISAMPSGIYLLRLSDNSGKMELVKLIRD